MDQNVSRFSVSLPGRLLEDLDAMVREKGYANRSLAIADMVRDGLVEHRQNFDDREIAGTTTLVYDHHRSQVQAVLTDLQHDHHHDVISTIHPGKEQCPMKGRKSGGAGSGSIFNRRRGIALAAISVALAIQSRCIRPALAQSTTAPTSQSVAATQPSVLPEGSTATTTPTTTPTTIGATVGATPPPERVNEVVVRGRAEDLVGVADTSNEGYVGGDELKRRPILRPAEILEAVPGLVITQHSGPGKANQYFLRGFQLDHGTDFAVTLNDVPQNLPSHAHGQGYLDLNYMIPELVNDIEYRKGPYSADVGDFSSAGSADIHYVNTLPRGVALFEGGSYGYARALIANSGPLGKGNLLYAFEYGHEDGPWDRPDAYKKVNAVLRYSQGDQNMGWSVTGTGYHGEWRATNQVAERAIDQGLIDRFGTLDPYDAGNSQRYTVVGEGHQKDVNGETRIAAYGAWYDMDLFNDFTYFLNDPIHGDEFEQQDRRFYSGVRAYHTFYTQIFGRDSSFTVGVQVRNDDINNGLYTNEHRVRLSTVTKNDILETSVGVYVENRTQWLEKFRTEASARVDYYNMNVSSNLDANSGNVNTAIFSPKVNLVFGPWYKTEIYLSGGYGFHSNDARGVTTTIVPSTLVPTSHATPLVRGKGAEVGVRTGIVPNLQSTVTVWALDLDSEEVFNGDSAETVPGRPSRRYGVELSNFYTPTDWLSLDGDYSLSRAKYRDHDPAVGDDVPESIASVLEAGITVHDLPRLRGLFGSLRVRYFGPRPLIEDNSVQSNSSTLINAQIGYHFDDVWTLRADFLNLANTKTDDIQYYYTSRLRGEPAGGVNDKHIHPAEPFEVRVGLEAHF